MIQPSADIVRFELLGPISLIAGPQSAPLTAWGKRKARLLLLVLLTASTNMVSRETINEVLWPDLSPEVAANNLYPTLHEVRTYLAQLAVRPVIHLLPDSLALELPTGIEVDWRQFVTLAHDALLHPENERRTLQALALYRGPLNPDPVLADWVWTLREQLANLHERLLLQLADWRARAGLPTAHEPLDQLLASEPTHEGALQRLLLLHAQSGRRDSAQRLFTHFCEVLTSQLDLAPLPETVQIANAIKQSNLAELPLESWGLGAYRPALSVPLPFAAPSLPLLGREPAWQDLHARAQAVLRGTGQAVLLTGLIGIGKTHLALHLAQTLHQQGWHVLLGTATRTTCTLNYALLTEALATYLAHLAAPEFDPQAQQALATVLGSSERLGAATANEVLLHLGIVNGLQTLSQRTPLVLICDDLEWADPASQAFLAYLIRRIGSVRLLLIMCQQHDVQHSPPLIYEAWQRSERQSSVCHLALPGLDSTAVQQLLHLLLGPLQLPPAAAQAMLHRAEGNPLFVREMVGMWVNHQAQAPASWSLPAAMVDAVLARLQRLSARALRLAQLGALAENLFMPSVLAEVEQLSTQECDQALGELVHQGIVIWQHEQRLSFTHDLVREVLIDMLPSPVQEQLHGALGAVAQLLEPALPAAQVLRHFAHATPTAENRTALAYYGVMAGENAVAAEPAMYAFSLALHALRAVGGSRQLWQRALLGLGQAAFTHGSYAEAAQAYQEAGGWTTAEPALEAQRLIGLGWVAYKQGDRTKALHCFQAGSAIAPSASTIKLDGQAGEALLLHLSGSTAQAATMLSQVLLELPLEGADHLRTRTLNLLGATAMEQGDAKAARAYYDQALLWAKHCGDSQLQALILTNLANLSVRIAELPTALAYLDQAEELNRQLGHDFHLGLTYSLRGWACYYTGDLVLAATALEQALLWLQGDTQGQQRASVLHDLARVRRVQGAWSEGLRLAQQALGLARAGQFALPAVYALHELALLHLAANEPDLVRCEQWAREALALAQQQERQAWEAPSWIVLGQVLLGQGRINEASRCLQTGLDQAQRNGLHLTVIEAQLVLAKLALAEGAFERAAQELAAVEARATACGAGLLANEAAMRRAVLVVPAQLSSPLLVESSRLPRGYETLVLELFDADPSQSLRALARQVGAQRNEPPRNHHTIRAILARYGRKFAPKSLERSA